MRQPPNILLIVADDMGYGDFGLFNPAARTPAIDELARTGVCLTQHYSASPVCAPARAALLTGRYPHRTGAIDTFEHRGGDRIALREQTLADALRAAGYATALIGKWHNGAGDPRFHPNARGFDEFAGFRGGFSDYYTGWLEFNDRAERNNGTYLTDRFTDLAIDFIGRHRNRPFFLHLAYNAPHFPFQCPEPAVKPFRDTGRFTKAVNTIYGMNLRMDQGIERVLDALQKQGLSENTLILFTSDNGPQLGGKGQGSTDRYNCNYNGGKGNMYEGGIRVPMVLRWPAGFNGNGRRVDDMVHYTDWFPTILAAAGAATHPALPLDGQNVLPALQGDRLQTNPTRYWQWNRYTPVSSSNAAVRDGDWKLLRPAIPETLKISPEDGQLDFSLKQADPRADSSTPPTPRPFEPFTVPAPQLFNLRTDPAEQHDLSAAEPDRVFQMSKALDQWFESVERDRQGINAG